MLSEDKKDKLKIYHKKYKSLAVEKFGNKCVSCGCDNIDALEFRHINGGNSKRNKKLYRNQYFYRNVFLGRITDIELTCGVCKALHFLVKLKKLPNNWKVTYTS
jgi:hypothetical protein